MFNVVDLIRQSISATADVPQNVPQELLDSSKESGTEPELFKFRKLEPSAIEQGRYRVKANRKRGKGRGAFGNRRMESVAVDLVIARFRKEAAINLDYCVQTPLPVVQRVMLDGTWNRETMVAGLYFSLSGKVESRRELLWDIISAVAQDQRVDEEALTQRFSSVIDAHAPSLNYVDDSQTEFADWYLTVWSYLTAAPIVNRWYYLLGLDKEDFIEVPDADDHLALMEAARELILQNEGQSALETYVEQCAELGDKHLAKGLKCYERHDEVRAAADAYLIKLLGVLGDEDYTS